MISIAFDFGALQQWIACSLEGTPLRRPSGVGWHGVLRRRFRVMPILADVQPGRYSVVAAYAHAGGPDDGGPYWRGRVTSAPVTIEIRRDPGAPKVSWGPAANGLQAAILPRGVPEIEEWERPFLCPKCTPRRPDDPSGVCRGCGSGNESIYLQFCKPCALVQRVCQSCGARRPPGSRFEEREPVELEFRLGNVGDADLVLADAGHVSSWRFRAVPEDGGPALIGHYSIKEDRMPVDISVRKGTTEILVLEINEWCAFDTAEQGSVHMNDPKVLPFLPVGKYTMTASYGHASGHPQRGPCGYWHGDVTTGPVEIEIVVRKP